MARGFGSARFQVFIQATRVGFRDMKTGKVTYESAGKPGKGASRKFGSKSKPTKSQIQSWKKGGRKVKIVDMGSGWI
jgi:hypothetical protein